MRAENPQSFSMSKRKKNRHKTKQKLKNKVNIVLSNKEMKDNGKRKFLKKVNFNTKVINRVIIFLGTTELERVTWRTVLN